MYKILIFFLFFLGAPKKAYAYPNFIHMGYGSCMSCHYNPLGNGPLTDYGRSVSATGISARTFWDKQASDEEVAEKSSFLRRKPFYPWLRPSLNFRLLMFQQDIYAFSDANRRSTSNQLMDFGGSLVLKFSDRLFAVGQITFAVDRYPAGSSGPRYRSREHYLGFKINKVWSVYAGLMDKAFGLRIPEHIAYSRMYTQNTHNDQTHGAMVHYMLKPFEISVQGYMGNLAQSSDLRQKGVAAQIETEFFETYRIGGSVLSSSSQYVSLLAYAAHMRLGFAHKASLLFESGLVDKTDLTSSTTTQKFYEFSQFHYLLKQGLFSFLTFEYAKPDTSDSNTFQYRVGPGLQYFPNHGIEIRGDLACTVLKSASLTAKRLDFLLQTHFYL